MTGIDQQLMYFVVMLNPFAQAIALWELMKHISAKDFAVVYGKASVLSCGVYLLFFFVGDYLVANVFQIDLAALRVFGGLIMVSIAYRNIALSVKTNVLLNAKVSDLAQEISLPYIIGPATLWLCIMMGQNKEWGIGAVGIILIMFANWALLTLTYRLVTDLERHKETLAGKYLSVLMKTNSLFIGAIGVDMIIAGIEAAVSN